MPNHSTQPSLGLSWRSRTARTPTVAHDVMLLVCEIAAILSIIALVWTTIWVSLANEYRGVEHNSKQDIGNLARAFEDNAQRIVAGIDQTLLSLRASFAADTKRFNVASWERSQNRPDRLRVQIGLINAAGTVVDTTLAPSVSGIDVSDREHFKVQLDPAHDDLFISKPVFGRSSGRQTVQFSRKLLNKDGSFGGVAVVSVGCDELSNFYEALQVGGFVLLAGLDGIVRARGPVAAAQVSSDLRDEPYFADVISKRHGTIHDTDGPGRMHRILSYRQLENYPLFVLVGVDEEHVFAGYLATRNRWMSIGFIVTLIVALLGSCWIVQRRRSTASRRALLITLDSMSQGIVMTDARGRVPVMN